MHLDSIISGLPVRNWLINGAFDSIADDVLTGLTAVRKYIPSKYFYDARGSQLFEEICRLPEYYPTRTELQILHNHAEGITKEFRRGNLVELGSGSHRKIRILLDALGPKRRVVRDVHAGGCQLRSVNGISSRADVRVSGTRT